MGGPDEAHRRRLAAAGGPTDPGGPPARASARDEPPRVLAAYALHLGGPLESLLRRRHAGEGADLHAHGAAAGVLLSLAPQLLHAPELCLGAFGLDRLDDQRFGGALMAVGGGLPYLLGGIVPAYRFISD